MNPLKYVWARQLLALAVALTLWEAAGRAGWLNPLYFPAPSAIGSALVELFSFGTIWTHLEATFAAAIGGLALGIAVGVLLGSMAALVKPIAELIEPVMMMLN